MLFLCTGNSARSQMAEGLLRRHAGGCFEIQSAGLQPRTLHPLAVRAMAEIGIDIARQHSKGLDEIIDLDRVLFVIFVCEKAEQHCPQVFSRAVVRLSWLLDDPSATQGSEEKRLQKFREVRDEINTRILQWLDTEVPPAWLRGRAGTRDTTTEGRTT